jgi:hypothetical protein
MKKIVVVGLLPGQAKKVESGCPEASLTFVQADKKNRLPPGEHVVLVTKFIRHGWTESAYKKFDRENIHFHDGGISGLIVKIKGICKEQGRGFFKSAEKNT